MGGAVSQGFNVFGFFNAITLVTTDARANEIVDMIGTNSFDVDEMTGKPVPFQAFVKRTRYLPKTPGYQLVEVGLPDRDGAKIMNVLMEAGMVKGFSAHEAELRELEKVQNEELDDLKDRCKRVRTDAGKVLHQCIDAFTDNEGSLDEDTQAKLVYALEATARLLDSELR